MFQGKKATVMGLGRFGGGVAAARYLAQQGAEVTITDRAPKEKLAASIAALECVPIAVWRLGEHSESDFTGADLVVVNPAVRPGDPFLELAARHGVPLTSEIELFLEACPTQHVVGVTGSNGKSTTAAMTAAILEAAGLRTWLGGNIGRSLLEPLWEILADDWVVLELSSFQLARLSARVHWPAIAVVTNCSPNHLDWHPDYDDYRRAKQRLLRHQQPHDVAVLNRSCPEVDTWRSCVQGELHLPLADELVPPLLVLGRHNRANAALAAAAGLACGVPPEAISRGLSAFRGLPHRLERVAEFGGRQFYNDSLATTPEAAQVALAAFDAPVWLLAGGADKGTAFDDFARFVAHTAAGAAFYGATGPRLAEMTAAERPRGPLTVTGTLDEALAWCWRHSSMGDVILLAPACASFDQFEHFADRGETFTRLVHDLRSRERLATQGGMR